MLSIKQLNKTYANGVKAINNVSLEIPNGMFGLLGPNGAGKSSLMRTIATLQDPDSGSIDFNGLDVLKDKEGLRRQLGYLPQDFGVYPKVSAEKLLNHFAVLKGLTAKGERKEAVEALLHQTNLWEARKRDLGTFSGGMRQRFGIAQALLGAPRLVIVDEPTAGLDPDERNRFLNLLAKIGEQVVVILSTHIVEDVTDLCPRMAMIVKGTVLVQGEPQAAIDTLRSRVWRRTRQPGSAGRLPATLQRAVHAPGGGAARRSMCSPSRSRTTASSASSRTWKTSTSSRSATPPRGCSGNRCGAGIHRTGRRIRSRHVDGNSSSSSWAIQLRQPLLWVCALIFGAAGLWRHHQRCDPDRRQHRQRQPQCAGRRRAAARRLQPDVDVRRHHLHRRLRAARQRRRHLRHAVRHADEKARLPGRPLRWPAWWPAW